MLNFNLDPCHYFTTPGFSWSAALKTPGIELDLAEEDMYLFFKQGMRRLLIDS